MPDRPSPPPLPAVDLEDDFVSPLTAIQGLLEVLRDCPDLSAEKRRHFADIALADCARLGQGIDRLQRPDGDRAAAEAAEAVDGNRSGRHHR